VSLLPAVPIPIWSVTGFHPSHDTIHLTASGEGLYIATLQGLITGFLFPLLPWTFFREVPAPDFFHPLEPEAERVDAAGSRVAFTVRGGQAGEWIAGVAFGPRMQVGVGLTGSMREKE
jgi:hypothetical protein